MNQDLTSIFFARFRHQNLQKITLKTTPSFLFILKYYLYDKKVWK